MRQESNVLSDVLTAASLVWRHRKGNEIPAAVLDTIDALWPEDKRPIMVKQTRCEGGYTFVINLPAGMAYSDFQGKAEYFQTATGKRVNIENRGKATYLHVVETELESCYSYNSMGSSLPNAGILPLTLGMMLEGGKIQPYEYDLVAAPHIFISGPTRKGKSNMLRLIATHLTLTSREKCFLVVIDYGAADFHWLEDYALVVTEIDEAAIVLEKILQEMVRRENLLKRAKANKVSKLQNPPPYIVLIIDEWIDMAEDEDSVDRLNKILRKGAKLGIHVIAGAQRLDSRSMKSAGAIKNNFPVRISFRCDRVNSDMVLGCDAAAKLPNIPGRCILMDSDEPKELQTFLIEPEDSEALIKGITGRRADVLDHGLKRLPAR